MWPVKPIQIKGSCGLQQILALYFYSYAKRKYTLRANVKTGGIYVYHHA